jgi:hypothetical protein
MSGELQCVGFVETAGPDEGAAMVETWVVIGPVGKQRANEVAPIWRLVARLTRVHL